MAGDIIKVVEPEVDSRTYIKSPSNRDEWLALRRHGIGGSEVAAVLGRSPWMTPLDVWRDKIGEAEADDPTLAMELGNELEDWVAKRYAKMTGWTVRNYGYMVKLGHAIADVDRLVSVDGKMPAHHEDVRTDLLLECKTASTSWDGEVPLYYQTQVQWYMGVLGVKEADVAVLQLAPGKDFRIYRLAFDESVFGAMLERVEQWWRDYVVTRTPPPAVNLADVKKLYYRSAGETVKADASIVEAVSAMKGLQAELKEREARFEELQKVVCEAMRDADTVLAPDGTKLATWKSSKDRTVVDYKAAATASGVDLAPYTSTKPGARVFRLA